MLGFDPMIQVIHERDVVRALLLSLKSGSRGIFNIKGPGETRLSDLLKRLGKPSRAVPASIAHGALDQLWRMRLSSFPPPQVDHIRYQCMVDDERARNYLGFAPAFDLDSTLTSVHSDF